ncbi:hypothetical protein DEU56DRAFT_757071 [Suillus clintonianus]|uniref:uncharacterized protein n=1 Tax=Suillus clintonianus TaxID=1904413 RepID=UPI001B867374|nr:uncharacterized protein DEU56DRAFT_757071 [Suillus clintonianus]KAG2133730.1 hypothetical protein DEU56DRAFT_757071 [Suillus clintonianus]
MPDEIPHAQLKRWAFSAHRIQCPYPGCKRWLKNSSGLKLHQSSAHSHSFTHPGSQRTQHASVEEIEDEEAPRRTNNELWESKHGLIRDYHETLTGRICDENGNFVDHGTPPPPYTAKSPDDWTPYRNRLEFECADFMYTENQMSAGDINKILYLWGITLAVHCDNPPFADYKDLYNTIDATPLGDVAWESFSLKYNGDKPAGECPLWMEQSHEVWFRDPHTVIKNMLANPDFKGGIDYTPYREFQEKDEQRRYKDFMSGDWAWQQAVQDEIAQDPQTHGSDKTTVSVATGQNDYYPLYLSIRNVHNNVRRAHRNALALVGFLAIPKTEKRNTDELGYRKFKKQLFHSSLSRIFANLKPGMTTPEVTRCGDGHYWRIIYGLGPYIADYEEQVVLACMVKDWCGRCLAFPSSLDEGGVSRSREHTDALVDSIDFGILWDEYGIIGELVPFTNDFPRADIHELLAPDILHQLIKGTFKDHLVEWVGQYLELTHSKTRAKAILDDIDRRIASALPFPGLRHFPQGRGFSQWTGDDSKALMKVYLPAIEGHVPDDMVRAFRALLEFCYICARGRSDRQHSRSAERCPWVHFHTYRTIFETTGVRFDISLPRQHSLIHYELLIRMFGAPNSLCSSITESKHIKVVKQPWRRSSKYNALSQMLLTNQRLDKGLVPSATTIHLNPSYIENDDGDPEVRQNPAHAGSNPFAIESDDFDDVEDQERKRARTVTDLADKLDIPSFPTLIRLFLYDQIHTDDHHSSADVPLRDCPSYTGPIKIFHSAAATFIAPSDPSGITGMRREHIRVVPSWRKGPARFDCAFVNTDDRHDGIHTYPCALVQWFHRIAEERDELTGMWMVAPSFNEDGSRDLSVIHIDSIIHGAHLLPIFGTQLIPRGLRFYDSLDVYRGFYVNHFIDHHAFELAS